MGWAVRSKRAVRCSNSSAHTIGATITGMTIGIALLGPGAGWPRPIPTRPRRPPQHPLPPGSSGLESGGSPGTLWPTPFRLNGRDPLEGQ